MKKKHGVFMFSLMTDWLWHFITAPLYLNMELLMFALVLQTAAEQTVSGASPGSAGSDVSLRWFILYQQWFTWTPLWLTAAQKQAVWFSQRSSPDRKTWCNVCTVEVQSGLCCPLKAQVRRGPRWGGGPGEPGAQVSRVPRWGGGPGEATHSRAADRKHFQVPHS